MVTIKYYKNYIITAYPRAAENLNKGKYLASPSTLQHVGPFFERPRDSFLCGTTVNKIGNGVAAVAILKGDVLMGDESLTRNADKLYR